MAIPLLELEGTAEQIKANLPDFDGRRLHIIVLPVETEPAEKDIRPLDEKLAEIAARIPSEELAKIPSDFCDQLDHYIYGTPKR